MMPLICTSEILAQGLLRILYAVLGCAAVVLLFYFCFRPSPEGFRKLLHLSVVATVSAWLYAFDDWRLGALTMAAFVALVCPILLLLEHLPRLPKLSWRRKKGELRMSLCALGAMFLVVTAVCCGLFGSKRLALASLFAWGPGDAAAALIGKRFGKTKIGPRKKKSLEGTLSLFACALLGVFVILAWPGGFGLWRAALTAILTAAVTAVVELYETRGLDTFFCPVAAAAVLCLLRAVL